MAFETNVDFELVQGNGVTRGQLMSCDPPAIISGYSSKTRMRTVDILIDTSEDIGYLNLFLFMISFMLLTYLLSLDRRFRRKYRSALSVMHYIMQKIPINIYNTQTVLISITLTITLMFLIISFSSLLHVSLVKVDPPLVINDYDDILGRLDDALQNDGDFRVAWSWNYPDTELFKRAEPGSKEALIWHKNVQNGGPDYLKLSLGLEDMKRAEERIKNQTMVIILNMAYSFFFRHCFCVSNDENINFHSWISVDKYSKWNQKGYVIRESLSGPLRSWLDDRMLRILESGVRIYTNRLLVDLKFPILSYSRKNCSSDEIVMENYYDSGVISNQQFAVTYYTCAVLLIMAFIALCSEKLLFQYQNRPGIKINVVNIRKIECRRNILIRRHT